MAKFFITLFMIFTAVQLLQAQEIEQITGVPENETKAERKARMKQLEQLRDSIAYLEADMAIDSGYFVVMAKRISLDGRVNIMSPEANTNFILVQGDHAIVQLAFNNGFSGLNGLGGITVEGTVTNRKKKITKKGDIYHTFGINGTSISAQISVSIYRNTNQATVIVNPNFNSNDLTVYGPLIPYDHSNSGRYENRVFKGKTTP